MKKQCSRCRFIKSVYNFYVNKCSLDGFRNVCKKCENNASKKRKEKYIQNGLCRTGCGKILISATYCQSCIEKASEYRKNRRRQALEILGGAFCSNCKCDIFELLEINHVNGGGNIERKKVEHKGKIEDEIIQGKVDITKYNILCKMCNQLHYVENLLGFTGFKVTYTKPPIDFSLVL